MSQLFKTFANCLKIPELRSRILFTGLVLVVARLVSMTPVPGLDGGALSAFLAEQAKNTSGGNSVLALYSLFTGGAIERCAVGALGIMPYISATIIIQLLSAVVPALNKLLREEGGRAKIIAYGRYLTVLLCLGQGFFMSLGWENPQATFNGFPGKLVMIENVWVYRIQTTIILTTATLLLMWLGEQITERGVGNGVSLIIMIGILARLPNAVQALWKTFWPSADMPRTGNWMYVIFLLLLLVAVVGAVVMITQGQRKIPVQYAQRAIGRKVYSGGTSYIPLKVNYTGVMPVIFAQAILMLPGMLLQKAGQLWNVPFFLTLSTYFSYSSWIYFFIEGALILFFAYFWVATQFNELQIADDLKKHGGYIPGVRPGQATADTLHRTMNRITFAGGIFLVVIALIPTLMTRLLQLDYSITQFFGGTSMLITVGVVLDTMRQMESFLLMRNYDGFLKKGRVRGRT
ncbi:MAG TPA: preprotein translocase subunit SecY [Verrucomicrobiales bacterium]|nr:preprotein translocase subunit SecY [Verrucomicrobiales bacterium]